MFYPNPHQPKHIVTNQDIFSPVLFSMRCDFSASTTILISNFRANTIKGWHKEKPNNEIKKTLEQRKFGFKKQWVFSTSNPEATRNKKFCFVSSALVYVLAHKRCSIISQKNTFRLICPIFRVEFLKTLKNVFHLCNMLKNIITEFQVNLTRFLYFSYEKHIKHFFREMIIFKIY